MENYLWLAERRHMAVSGGAPYMEYNLPEAFPCMFRRITCN